MSRETQDTQEKQGQTAGQQATVDAAQQSTAAADSASPKHEGPSTVEGGAQQASRQPKQQTTG